MQSTTSASPAMPAPTVRVQGVSYRYADSAALALDDVSLDIPAGSTFGLLGPNGAGKTTLLSLLTGLRPPQQGRIEIAGYDLAREAREIKAISALVPQDYAFYLPLSARENLEFFADIYGVDRSKKRERIAFAVEVCRLEEVFDQRAAQYSGGLKRRLNLAIGLLNAPRILYLDEPTVGVDARSRQTLLAALGTLKAEGITIVYTSHYMEEVQSICDHLSIIDHGHVRARDSMQAFLARIADPRLKIVLASAMPESAPAALATWNPLALDASTWTFTTTDGIAEVEKILAILQAHGATVVQLQYGVNRLEEIYLGLLDVPTSERT